MKLLLPKKSYFRKGEVSSSISVTSDAVQTWKKIAILALRAFLHTVLHSKSTWYSIQRANMGFSQTKILIAVLVFVGFLPLGIGYVILTINNSPQLTAYAQQAGQLAPTVSSGLAKLTGSIGFNIPVQFSDSVLFQKGVSVVGPSTLDGGVTVLNGDINVGTGNVFASNLLYSLTAGTGITITGGTTPTVTNNGVLSLQGATGAVSFTPGSGISISGLTISNTATLSSIRAQGGCDNCLKDSDIDGSITISSDGDVSAEAIKTGVVPVEHGGTGATSLADLIQLGTNTTGDYVASVSAGNGLTVTGTSGEGWIPQFSIVVPTTGVTSTISANSGLEVTTRGISMIQGCGDGEILKWNATSVAWECNSDMGGSGASGVINIKENNVLLTSNANTLDFLGSDFTLTESPAGEVNVVLDYANSGITRKAQSETINGSWTFSNGLTVSGGAVSLPAGSISNASLANSSLTVTAGSGLSGGGSVSLGGTVTLTNAGVTSLTGTANQVIASGGTGAVTLSLPQSIATNSTPTFATQTLTGATSLTLGTASTNTGAVVYKNSTNANTTTIQSGAAGANLTFTLPTTQGSATQCLKVSNGTGTLAWDDCFGGTGGTSGVTSVTGTTNQVAVSGSTGAVTFSLPQNIHTAATPTFSALNLSATTNQLVLSSGGTTGTLTWTPTTTNKTITFPDATGTVCLTTGNCAGAGGGVTGTGTTNYLTKFTSGGVIGDSSIFDNGNVGIGTTTPLAKLQLGAGSTTVAPLKLTSGTNLTIPEAGAVEYDGTDLYYTTTTSPTRMTVVNTTATQTLTNKTIAAGSNTISGLTNSNLSGSAGISNANLANSSLTVTAGTGMSGGGSVSLGGTVTLTNAGVTSLTGTANQVTVSGSTGAITLSLPQSIHTAATPTFASQTLSATTNQLVLGTTNTTTISSIAPAAGRIATIPALNASDTFAFLAQAQTLTNKTIAAGSNTITGLTNTNLSGTAGITNANLANSSLTVTAGTGMSGGGSVSLGGTVTLTNAGVTTLTGTANQVIASGSTGAVTLSLPQSIGTSSAPTFATLNLSGTSNQLNLGTTNIGTLTWSPTTARTITFPDATGTVCLSIGNCASSSVMQRNLGALSPTNITDDFLLGSTATASAKIRLGGTTNASSFFNTGGNVGIGTTTPTYVLDVYGNLGTTDVAAFRTDPNNSGNTYALTVALDNMYGAGNYKSQLSFRSAGTEKYALGVDMNGTGENNFFLYDAVANATPFLIDSSGNVGIGTTNPQAKLDLYGGGISVNTPAAASNINITSDGTNVVLGAAFQNLILNTGSEVVYYMAPIDMANHTIYGDYYASGGNLTLESTFQSTKGYVNIAPNGGNVGIGTTAPRSLLQVGDDVDAGNTPAYLSLWNHSSTRGFASIVGNWGTTDMWGIGPLDQSSNTLRIGRVTANTNQWTGTQDTNLVIGGNVGIGTTSTTAKLSVYGTGGINVNDGFSNIGNITNSAGAGLVLQAVTGSVLAKSSAANNSTGFVYADSNAKNSLLVTDQGSFTLGVNEATTITTPLSAFSVTGAYGGKALAIFNQKGTGSPDIFTASASGTTQFVIKNNGNVGIGFSNGSASDKLSVNGDIGAQGVIYAKNGTAYLSDVQLGTNNNTGTYNVGNFTSTGSLGLFANNAEAMRINSDGNVGVGTATTTAAKLTVNGAINATFATAGTERLCWDGSGSSNITDCTGTPGDYAEEYGSTDASIAAGDIVMIDPDQEATAVEKEGAQGSKAWIKKAASAYEARVIGVVSTAPNDVIGQAFSPEDNAKPVALSGRVPVNVSAKNGAIKKGDAIVASDIPGVGMKATRAGSIIGKALNDYAPTDVHQVGKIFVFVNVSWFDPSVYIASNGELSAASLTNTALQNIIAATVPNPVVNTNTVQSENGLPDQDISSLNQLTASLSALDTRLKTIEETQKKQAKELAKTIVSTPVTLLASTAAELNLPTNTDENMTIAKDLTVLGRTVVTDLGITGNVTTGLLSIHGLEGEIQTVGTPLRLQPAGLAGVDIFGGKIVMNTDGTITTTGTVVAKEIKTEKITITEGEKDGAVLSSSAGTVLLKAGQKTVEIKTKALSAKSLIFATPDEPIAVGTKMNDSETFVISIKDILSEDLKIQWWVVN